MIGPLTFLAQYGMKLNRTLCVFQFGYNGVFTICILLPTLFRGNSVARSGRSSLPLLSIDWLYENSRFLMYNDPKEEYNNEHLYIKFGIILIRKLDTFLA
jgi:hypothetical protein